MPKIGLEPTHLTAPEPKSGVSTNFTTWAKLSHKNKPYLGFCQSVVVILIIIFKLQKNHSGKSLTSVTYVNINTYTL